MMYIDIDKFKAINDSLGHDVVDKLLQQFARLKSSERENNVICRVGRDEFLVLLSNIEKKEQVIHIVEQMCDVFQKPYRINEHRMDVTASIGITLFPEDP